MTDQLGFNSIWMKLSRSLGIILLVLGVLMLTLTGKGFIEGHKVGIYWLEVLKFPAMMVPLQGRGGLIANLVVVSIVGVVLSYLSGKSDPSKGLVFVIITVLIELALYSYYLPFNLYDFPRHDDVYRIDGQVYYLADRIEHNTMTMVPHGCWETDDPECWPMEFTHEYSVFRCDAIGLFCRRLDAVSRQESMSRPHGEFAFNPTTGDLSVLVDGIPIWPQNIDH